MYELFIELGILSSTMKIFEDEKEEDEKIIVDIFLYYLFIYLLYI